MNQNYYLQQMGIVTYRSHMAEFCGYVFLLGNPDQSHGLLIAALHRPPTATEEQLIQKILSAMKIPHSGGYHYRFQPKTLAPNITMLLSLGKVFTRLWDKHLKPDNTLVTSSLTQLIANPALKRDAWLKIQQAMSLLSVKDSA